VNRRLQAGIFLAVALLAGVFGFYLSRGNRNSPASDAAAQALILAPLSDLNGNSQVMSRWRGKVLVVNFWATWCAPCREEIPVLMSVQHVYATNGVQFVGIAIDNISKVRDYAAEMHIDYILLMGGIEALVLSKDLGNRAGTLPFTVVLDRSGKVVYAHAGAVTEAILGPILHRIL
jgi:thiol-disulfide isomerase/thioredoxin